MKILHVCLASHFTEGLTYQDNILPDEHEKLGHNVLVVSDNQIFRNGKLIHVAEEDKRLSANLRLVRFEYDQFFSQFFSSKIRRVARFKALVNSFQPDVILFHGVAGWEMLTVANYKKKNPTVKLYIDSHEDFNNSATNLISYYLQYRLFNNLLVSLVRPFVDKFLYITSESKEFLKRCYGLSDNEIEYYPLGGIVHSDQEYMLKREKTRSQHGLSSEDIVFLQTGKFDTKKKLAESLVAFKKTTNENFRFYILGKFIPEIEAEVNDLILSDSRINYLGWANAEILTDYLCACDVYVQPGSQSATMQMSLCARCAIILEDVISHRDVFCDNGWLLNECCDLNMVFNEISINPEKVSRMKDNSFNFAQKNLDYRMLAERVLR